MPHGTQLDAPVRRAVLSLNGGPTDKLVIECGCKLARADQAELTAVYVVEVNWSHDGMLLAATISDYVVIFDMRKLSTPLAQV